MSKEIIMEKEKEISTGCDRCDDIDETAWLRNRLRIIEVRLPCWTHRGELLILMPPDWENEHTTIIFQDHSQERRAWPASVREEARI